MRAVIHRLLPIFLILVGASCSAPSSDSADPAAGPPQETEGSPLAAAPEPTVGAGDDAPAPAEPTPPVASNGDSAPLSTEEASSAQGSADASEAGEGGRSVYEGVYTRAQAARGEEVMNEVCSACHAAGDWGRGQLLRNYTGLSAFDLVNQLRNTMPMDSPGRLTWQQYTDVVAFMLRLNNVPTGGDELGPDAEELREIRLEYRN